MEAIDGALTSTEVVYPECEHVFYSRVDDDINDTPSF